MMVAPPQIRPSPVEKPASERLSKTVMPNAVRTLSPPDPFRVAAGSAGAGGREGSQGAGLVLEPPVERAIKLQLGDILDNFPPGFAKPVEGLDLEREISLKGSEVEKGMSTGQPTVSLASIYEEIPDVFAQRVALADVTQVALPYAKVLQQFQALHVRADQEHDDAVPQVETPFLQVTIEDTKKFGTNMSPLEASALPPVKVEPATAKTISKAEPEAVAKQKLPTRGIPLMPSDSFLQAPPTEPAPGPTRIPFHLPPNGTGVPVSERVPASSGPPVPTSPPKPPTTPSRIPFKITPPGADLRPKLTLVPGVEPKEPAPVEDKKPEVTKPAADEQRAEKKPEVMVSLGLNVIMKNLPAFQLAGPLSEIPDDVRITLPFSLIESQLPTGRVGVDPKAFYSALPEAYRGLFVVDPTETPVLLPLQEVLKNLPETALKMRADQERDEAVDHFETPFSRQAEEDEQRFRDGLPKPTEAKKETPEPTVEPAKAKIELPPVEPEAPKPAEAKQETGEATTEPAKEKIQLPAVTAEAEKPAEPEAKAPVPAAPEERHDAKEFVARASVLPGVAACSITFADGLSLAGNLPADIAADGLCAMAPSMLQKIDKHMADTNLGPLVAVTLHCAKRPLTFFMEGNVCLAVLHTALELEPDTQEKLAGVVKELSQVYAQPETAHVDH